MCNKTREDSAEVCQHVHVAHKQYTPLIAGWGGGNLVHTNYTFYRRWQAYICPVRTLWTFLWASTTRPILDVLASSGNLLHGCQNYLPSKALSFNNFKNNKCRLEINIFPNAPITEHVRVLRSVCVE